MRVLKDHVLDYESRTLFISFNGCNLFKTQWKYPVKDDWTTTVQKDLKDLDIGLDLDEIKQKSDFSFKRLVKMKTKEYALDFLMKIKEKHSKMEKLDYVELKLQNYLKDDKIPVKEAINLYISD